MNNSLVHTMKIDELALWESLRRKRAPVSFNLDLTARCNNDCRHCFINLPPNDTSAGEEELTFEEIMSIAKQAAEMGTVGCLITGGEPLLRSDFADIYVGLKQFGLLVGVFTNACLIGDRHVRLFKRYPPRNLEVTVYGVTRETYETVTCRSGSFAAFRSGLGRLLDAGVRVRLKAMALRSNLHEMGRIAEFCRRHTKDFYRFDPILHLRHDGDADRNLQIMAERLTPEEIVALEASDPERLAAVRGHCRELIQPAPIQADCDSLFHCGAGLTGFSVSYNGVFRLCDDLWTPGTTSSLRNTSLRGVWSEFVPRVRDLRSENPGVRPGCRACQIFDLCVSCVAHAYLETGLMEGDTPYFCAVAHARAAAFGRRAWNAEPSVPEVGECATVFEQPCTE